MTGLLVIFCLILPFNNFCCYLYMLALLFKATYVSLSLDCFLEFFLFLAAMSSSRSDGVTQFVHLSVRLSVFPILFTWMFLEWWESLRASRQFKSDSRRSQACFKHVLSMFQAYFKQVSRMFQGHLKDFSEMFQG